MWIIGFLFLFLGCTNGPNGEDDNEPNLRSLSQEEQSLATSSNAFVFHLLTELEKQEGDKNLFFSPLSVQYALSMTLNGASEETYNSIKETLGFDDLNEQEINAYGIPVEC